MNNIAISTKLETKDAVIAETATVKTASRVAYIDMLRGFLIALVIVFHAACTYNGSNDWTYRDLSANDTATGVGLSLFVLYCQSFFMSLYFFLSGVFTPVAYDKKGLIRYWKDRLLHLILPAVVYTLVISRIPNYLTAITNEGIHENFWEYSLRTFWTQADAGPTWFVYAVLIFSLLYSIGRVIFNRQNKNGVEINSWFNRIPAPGIGKLLLVAVGMAAAMFTVGQFMSILHGVRIFGAIPFILGFFPFYLVFFFGGILAYRNHWLEQWKASSIKFWGALSIILIILLPVLMIGGGALENDLIIFFTGFSWRCAALCLWLALACMSFGMSLTLWMREHIKSDSKLATFAGKNSYAVFLIHSAVLVAVSVSIHTFPWHPMLKFLVSSMISVPLCFVLAAILRKIPGLKQAL